VGQPGGQCYSGSSNVPMNYCETYQFIWAVGGKTVVYPEHVGFPFAVDGKPTYYLLEVHFDNPHNVNNITFETGVELFYTSKLRENDAGTLTAGHVTSWVITIPPKSEEYLLVGHCAPSCSSNIPETGINVFNILLHSHLAGRKLKLRHFRDGEELPWLSSDDNYNFDYQQNRPLLEEIKILPGDQLTYECTYNSLQANGTVIGGLSTSEEMCNTFLWYYPEIDLDACSSELSRTKLLSEFGIESVRGSSYIGDPLVSAPESLANFTYTQVLNTMISWTDEERYRVQHEFLNADHMAVCSRAGRYFTTGSIKYPIISKEYVPMSECIPREDETDEPDVPNVPDVTNAPVVTDTPGRASKQFVIQWLLYFIVFILAALKL